MRERECTSEKDLQTSKEREREREKGERWGRELRKRERKGEKKRNGSLTSVRIKRSYVSALRL